MHGPRFQYSLLEIFKKRNNGVGSPRRSSQLDRAEANEVVVIMVAVFYNMSNGKK